MLHHMATILVCYGGHFESKMAAKIQKIPPIWAKFGFQVDYDIANWYPLFGSHVMTLQIISYLVIIIIMTPKRSLWDILFLLCFLLLCLPNEVCETYCFSSVSSSSSSSSSYYYYSTFRITFSVPFLGDALIKLYETL